MSTGKTGFFSQNFAAILLHSARGKYGTIKEFLTLCIKWKEKYILFNVIIFFAGAALMLVMAVRASRARLALVNKGVKVQAVVAGTLQNRDGVSLALAFTTPSGDTRRLPYPVPRKAKGLRQGSQVTLYYDPDHPEKAYVEGDKAVLGAEMIYYVLAGLLLALGLVLLVML